MYEFDDDDDDAGGRGRTLSIAAACVLLALGWFVVRPALSDGDDGSTVGARGGGEFVFDSTPTTVTATTSSTTAATTTAPATTSTTSTLPATTTTTTEPPETTEVTWAGLTKSMVTVTSAATDATYVTLPDGSPVPVEVTSSALQVTLVGAVPSQRAADQLVAFAESIRLSPAEIVNELTINPAVPDTVGVRVVERNALVFNEGSSTVHPDHARQLDRFVVAMNSFPRSTVLVVAHSDQRNGEDRNLEISEERAQAVLEYLAEHGVDPARVSAVGVGESAPLTLEESEEAYQVNRRVDFLFSGLFTG